MRIRCGLYLVILASVPQFAVAGAWLQNDGDGQSITTLRFYETDQYIDKNGDRESIEPFTKSEIESYLEYGLTPKLTIGGDIDLAGVTNGAINSPGFDNAGLNSAEIFARALLYKGDSTVISIEPGIDFPVELSSDLTGDGDKPIPEVKLDFGYGFDAYDQHHFFDASVKYRKRDDNGLDDMVKFQATLGLALTDEYMVYLEASREQNLGTVNTTQGNYNLTKPQISFLYSPDEIITHQVGVFADVEGANIGAGYGLFYSFWYNF